MQNSLIYHHNQQKSKLEGMFSNESVPSTLLLEIEWQNLLHKLASRLLRPGSYLNPDDGTSALSVFY